MTDQDQSDVEATQVVDTSTPLTPEHVTPVAPVGGSPRTGRARWVVALGAVAIVTALTAAIVYALVGRSPDATVLGYVPSGTVAYGEIRLDLPGDQRREIGEFLSHFPGFADQAALDSKLDEVLDRLVSDASDGKQTFTTNIKPWFDGELAFSCRPAAGPEDSSRPAPRETGWIPSTPSRSSRSRMRRSRGPGSTMRSSRPAPRRPRRRTRVSS